MGLVVQSLESGHRYPFPSSPRHLCSHALPALCCCPDRLFFCKSHCRSKGFQLRTGSWSRCTLTDFSILCTFSPLGLKDPIHKKRHSKADNGNQNKRTIIFNLKPNESTTFIFPCLLSSPRTQDIEFLHICFVMALCPTFSY